MTAEVKLSNSVGSPTFSLDRSDRRPALICKKDYKIPDNPIIGCLYVLDIISAQEFFTT
jgi:hypothetical protein